MTQLILGLGNKARHGKDTFAAAVDHYFAKIDAAALKHGLKHTPVVVQHLAFADALYKEVNAALATENGNVYELLRRGVPAGGYDKGQEFIDIPTWVQPDPNPEISRRSPYGKHAKLLQWWGTEYRRAQDQDYWVKQWVAAINPKANIVLATDMRFLNEAAAVKATGGFTVRVSRKNTDGTWFIDPSRDSLHVSETQLDGYNYDFDITIKTGDQALLEEWAITLVHYLRAMKGFK